MHPADLWVHGLVNGLTAPLLNSPVGRRRISRIPCVSSIEGRRYPGGELVNDYRSESFPDHRFSTAYHLIDDVGGAHQSLGLTGRFTGQQAHLFEVTCELRGWRKSTKPVHGKLLPIKTGSTNHRKLRIRNDLIWWRIVTTFPFPHDAVAQSASRSIGEFRAEDKMTCSILDASSDDPVLVLRMGVGLEARE